MGEHITLLQHKLTKELGVAVAAISFPVVLRETSSSEWIHTESANKVLGVPLLVESVDAASSDRLTASRTEGPSLLMVVDLAVRLASKFEECASSKALLAILADEVLWMPLLTDSIHAFSLDGLVAAGASCGEHAVEASLAVRTRISFEERASLKRSQALSADEVVHVPFLPKSGDASVQNRFVAVSTTRAEKLLVAPLAVRQAVLLVEVGSPQRILAVATREMLWMEGLAQCLNNLSKNRLPADLAGAPRCWCVGIDRVHG